MGDDADLQEVYDTERHLLYVACTRARDHLLVTSVAPASEFLDDLADVHGDDSATTLHESSLRKSLESQYVLGHFHGSPWLKSASKRATGHAADVDAADAEAYGWPADTFL